MRNQTKQNIGRKTRSVVSIPDRDEPQPIRCWQRRFENHLLEIGRKATRERYVRALERFLAAQAENIYPHQFHRPAVSQYVHDRLQQGASVSTIRVELAAIRALWNFMLAMEAADVRFNVARGVKVPRQAVRREAETKAAEGTISSLKHPVRRAAQEGQGQMT